jgi:hypothetical protein
MFFRRLRICLVAFVIRTHDSLCGAWRSAACAGVPASVIVVQVSSLSAPARTSTLFRFECAIGTPMSSAPDGDEAADDITAVEVLLVDRHLAVETVVLGVERGLGVVLVALMRMQTVKACG